MKKLISILSAICMVVTMLPFSAYAANITPEISLDEFTRQLQELQAEYDSNYISEITIEDNNDFYHIDGEEFPVSDDCDTVTIVTENDFEIPLSAIEPYVELPEISTYSLDNKNHGDVTVDKETAEALGFEVEIEDDKAVLTQPYQTERLIVKSKYDINPLDSVAIVEGYNDLHIVQFDNQESAKQAETYYNKQKLIEYAEPDLIMSTMDIDYTVEASAVTSSSIIYDNHLSWGSESIGVDDYIDYLGEISELPEIVVGIIDTGVDIDHEFLKDRIIETNYNTSGSGTENSEDDDKGHGTHVAGIVVDNTTENVKIKSYKCLDENGSGNLSDVIVAIDAAVESGVDVINMSLGSKGSSSAMEKAVNNAVNKGVTVCVSAGNSGTNASKYTPANIDSCITVAAIDAYDEQPYWTNYGNIVDIVAPGVSIYSTYTNNNYATLSGTSMACPFVAAASALILSKNKGYNSNEICSILEENGRVWYKESDSVFSNSLYGKLAVYIGTVTEFNKRRTSMPKFSIESGRYSDSIILEINCEEENAEIYYTLDGSRASQENGILYTEPIIINKVTRVHATAYVPDKLKSLQTVADYYITYLDDEENFEINSDGLITAYNGTNNYLTIPDTIAGITVTGIDSNVFRSSNMVMIKLPDTLTYLGDRAFYYCTSLYSVDSKNIQHIGNYCFGMCQKLEIIDLTKVDTLGNYGLWHCESLTSLYNDKLTTINIYSLSFLSKTINIDLPNVTKIERNGLAFAMSAETINLPNVESMEQFSLQGCIKVESLDYPKLKNINGQECFSHGYNITNINLPELIGELPKRTFYSCRKLEQIKLEKITSINDEVFSGCSFLKILYLPSVISITGTKTFNSCYSLEKIFAPNLKSTSLLPSCDNITIYLSDSCTELPNSKYICNIIAPANSYAKQWASDNGHTFIPSDYRDTANDKIDVTDDINVRAYGRSIRITNAGLRFGFSWNAIPEIEDLASKAEYGFIYHYNYDNEPFESEKLTVENIGIDNVKMKKADNLDDTNEGKTVFNLVFINIPDKNQTTIISARAYVCIDGMYFYSNTLNGSFNEVAKLVLADNTVEQNIKNKVQNLLKEA